MDRSWTSFYRQIGLICISKKGRSAKTFDERRFKECLDSNSCKSKTIEEFEENILRDIPSDMRYVFEYTSKEPAKIAGTIRLMQIIEPDILISFSPIHKV